VIFLVKHESQNSLVIYKPFLEKVCDNKLEKNLYLKIQKFGEGKYIFELENRRFSGCKFA